VFKIFCDYAYKKVQIYSYHLKLRRPFLKTLDLNCNKQVKIITSLIRRYSRLKPVYIFPIGNNSSFMDDKELIRLIDEGKKFNFTNNSYSKNYGTFSRASDEFLSWIANIESYILNNYG